MSRARDQCILVRSLDISDIPSNDDVKIPIIAFFQTSTTCSLGSEDGFVTCINELPLILSTNSVLRLLVQRLSEMGYKVSSMGIVWKNGICIEHLSSDVRVALMVDDANDMYPDWQAGYRQQQKIERVGWKCMRVDLLSLLSDFAGTIQSITQFLGDAGIDCLNAADSSENHGDIAFASERDAISDVARYDVVDNVSDQDNVIDDIVTITSEDDDDLVDKGSQGDYDDTKKPYVPAREASVRSSKRIRTDNIQNFKQFKYAEVDEDTDESMYGSSGSEENAVVDLSFLLRGDV
jgi:hypothetical protein